MERPSEWIGHDPDFGSLRDGKNKRFTTFLDEQWKRDYPAEGRRPGGAASPRAPDISRPRLPASTRKHK
jgi:hypothetical protein